MRFEEGGLARLNGVTITGAGMAPGDSTALVASGGTSISVEKCVVADNRGFGLDCRAGGTATVSCSDFFANSAGGYAGCPDATGQNGNLAVDPRFCSSQNLDFHLQADSPARAACGAMGAFGSDPCRPPAVQAAAVVARLLERMESPKRISPRLIHWATVRPSPAGSFVR